MGYAVMLTGAGPARAFAQRVTHVVYLAETGDDTMIVLPFADLATRLREHGIHHAVLTQGGTDYVSISIPSSASVRALRRGRHAPAPRGARRDGGARRAGGVVRVARRHVLRWVRSRMTSSDPSRAGGNMNTNGEAVTSKPYVMRG